jgi:hypothetical protein
MTDAPESVRRLFCRTCGHHEAEHAGRKCEAATMLKLMPDYWDAGLRRPNGSPPKTLKTCRCRGFRPMP